MKSQQSEDSPVELRRRLSDNAYTSNEERTVLSVPNPSAESDGLDRDGMSDIAGTPDSSLSSSAQDETDSFLDSKVSATVKGDLRPRRSVNFNFDRSPSNLRRRSIPVKLEKTGQAGRYLLTADDAELRNILRQGIEREESGNIKKRRFKYRDLVFTRQFTAFDRQNPASASSPFHGFFTLFWLGVGLMLIKVAANNWRIYGTVWGKNEILRLMFHKDVLVLGLTDGVLCGSTIFCLFLQRAIAKGFLSWNRSGWIIQNVGPHCRGRLAEQLLFPFLPCHVILADPDF